MTAEHQFELTGGRLCLDFANTLDNRPGPSPQDYLARYADLLAWGRQTGVLAAREARTLLREAARWPRQAAATLARARELREVLFRMLSAAAARRRVASEDLALLNTFAADLLANSRLVQAGHRFALVHAAAPEQLDGMLAPVVRCALELMLSVEMPLLRTCAADNCDWLFLDNTKNHRRRWCDTRTCGNRAKVRRFRERMRKKS